MCSSASRSGTFRQEVRVGSQSTRSVPFIIIPMKEGKVSIEVKAAVKESWTTDGIRKHLLVVVREAGRCGQPGALYTILKVVEK